MRDHWESNYTKLKAFKKKHGHCNVPTNDVKYRKLGQWVSSLRYKYKIGELSKEKIKALEDLDFVWSAADLAWNKMYEQLVDYAKKNKTTNVLERSGENGKLARWIHSQRHRHKAGKMSAERIKMLDSIGFCWIVRGNDEEVDVPQKEEDKKEIEEVPAFKEETVSEKLYALRVGKYVQYNGQGEMPEALRNYIEKHNGAYPPHIPLPKGPVKFTIGSSFYKQNEVIWSGSGPLPENVLHFAEEEGVLPPYGMRIDNLKDDSKKKKNKKKK